MRKDRNCQSCDYYKNEYCSELDMKPCYPENGCDYFSEQNKIKKDAMQVLDKIRAEIKAMSGDIETIADVLAIIDKYKAEVELQKSEINEEKEKNPMKQTLDFLKNLYLQNKEEIDRVAKEYKVIEANKAESEE